jgi:hypothetical protein
MTILVTSDFALKCNSFNLNEIFFWPKLAASLLSEYGEDQNLTSSFRPPGGPTPTRGFFLPRATQAGAPFSRLRSFGCGGLLRCQPGLSKDPMDLEAGDPIALPR